MTPYAIFCAVAILSLGIAGVIGNLLIIGAILLENQLKNVGNVFIFNLAIVDIFMTGIVFPVIATNTIVGNILPNFACFITGAIAAAGTMISVLNIGAIAYERYIKVCHNSLYSRLFSKRIIPLHLIFIWAVIIASLIPPFMLGRKSFQYDDRVKLCIIELDNLPAWYLLIFAILLLSSILLCCVCYFKILLLVRQSKRRVYVRNAVASQVYSKKDMSLIKTMFTVFTVFLLLSFPVSINVIFISAKFPLPVELLQWSIYLVFCNSVVNGFIYGITNRQFRKGYMKVVSAIFCYQSLLVENIASNNSTV